MTLRSRLSRSLRTTFRLPLYGELSLHSLLTLLGAAAAVLLIWFGLEEHSTHVRMAFATFAVAIIGWVFTRINDTYIALAAAMSFALAGLERPEDFFSSLGDSMVWLLLAAFFVAAAVRQSGLARRLALAVAAKARSVEGLFYALTAVIVATAFFIPSTSGRAALLLPVFLAFAAVLPPRVVRALAILFPVAVLLSAVASLIGAGAHLITADVVLRMGGERLDFLRWMVLGTPLALVSTFASSWVILRLFLSKEERGQRLELARELSPDAPKKVSPQEWYVLGVVLALVGLWTTEGLHGLNNTLVALLGAMAVTLPRFGNISFKEGLKGVEWNILIFMAATLELGEALVESGAAKLLAEGLFAGLQGSALGGPWAAAGLVIGVSLLAHLVIVSRSARSTVLVPLVVVLAAGLGLDGTALAFASTAAAGFCLTLMVSAKPLGLYGQMDRPTFTQADLLRLSSVLMPLHAVIFAGFAFLVWPALGLSLVKERPLAPPPPPVWQAPPSVFKLAPPPVTLVPARPVPAKPSSSAVGMSSNPAPAIKPVAPKTQTPKAAPSAPARTVPQTPRPQTARPAAPKTVPRVQPKPTQAAVRLQPTPRPTPPRVTQTEQRRLQLLRQQRLEQQRRQERKRQLLEANQRREQERRAGLEREDRDDD